MLDGVYLTLVFASNDKAVISLAAEIGEISAAKTRANNVSQSARLLTFCVIDQSECMKFTMCKQKEWGNSTLFYGLRAIRYCTSHFKNNKL